MPISRDPELHPEVSALAERIAGGNEQLLEHATDIAEAQLDLQRVRHFRSELIARTLRDPDYGPQSMTGSN